MEERPPPRRIVEHLFRHEAGRIRSILMRLFGFEANDIVDDIVQETLLEALTSWSLGAIPANPQGWLMQVAKRKTINAISKGRNRARLLSQHAATVDLEVESIDAVFLEHEIEDSQLRMLFACCNPVLSSESQIAFALHTLCGLSVKEIAKALFVKEDAVYKRLARTRRCLRQAGGVPEVPHGADLKMRLDAVCTSLYLLFNEGYNSSHPDSLIRRDLCFEAIRLSAMLARQMSEHPKVYALLALMYFHAARFDSRQDDSGAIIIFEEQDRTRWSKDLIKRGLHFLARASKGDRLSSYHIEASIAAEHCYANSLGETNWVHLKRLYELLYQVKGSDIIRLNLAIISSFIEGNDRALQQLLQIQKKGTLERYYLFHATLGEFYQRTGNEEKARSCFEWALTLTNSDKEKVLLQCRIQSLPIILELG